MVKQLSAVNINVLTILYNFQIQDNHLTAQSLLIVNFAVNVRGGSKCIVLAQEQNLQYVKFTSTEIFLLLDIIFMK